MEFKEFISKLAVVLKGRKKQWEFTRDIFSEIVPEASHDILENYSESAYKGYYSGDSINRISSKIMDVADEELFVAYIQSLEQSAVYRLCEKFQEDISDITAYNVDERLASLFISIISDAASQAHKEKRSSEIDRNLYVYESRAAFDEDFKITKLLSTAKNIRSIGISNSDLCRDINRLHLINCINNNDANVELIFLDPDSEYTGLREKEEDVPEGYIKAITEFNIGNIIVDIRRQIRSTGTLRVFKYRKIPRMNIIIIDEHVILQFYSNNAPGVKNLTFYAKNQGEGSILYAFADSVYSDLKKDVEEI